MAHMEGGRLLLDVRHEDAGPDGLVVALDDHDAEALLPLVHLDLSPVPKLLELFALKQLKRASLVLIV